MRRIKRAVLAGVIAITLPLAACGTTKGGSTGEAQSNAGGVKTDFGVTDETITLGAMTDTSGVFKITGLGITQGNQLWADDVNAAGGICDRQIELAIKDNGYLADKAITLYAAMKDDVVGMVQLLGSPIIAALKGQITSDKMLSVPASWAAENLTSPSILFVGATYSTEIINGLAYLQKEGLITDGDKLGHIYIDSEYGEDGLKGSQYYAEQHSMQLEPVAIAGTDNDMTSAVTSLKSQGVNAIVLTTSPPQMASVATQMATQDIANLPILGNNPTWASVLLIRKRGDFLLPRSGSAAHTLNTPAKDALGNYYRAVSFVPYSSDVPLAQKIAKDYEAKYTEEPNDAIDWGYAAGLAMQAVLERACEDDDLTRAGIVDAATKVKVDTEGLSPPLDFSDPGQPPTRSTLIEQADASQKGGLVVVQPFTESKEAKAQKIGE